MQQPARFPAGTAKPTPAIVTPTYRPDLARAQLLCRSLDRCAPQLTHYLIVDRRDWAAFAHLAGPRRHILISEDLVGDRFWRTPGVKGYWLSLRAPPVRGWIIQQILKIAVATVVREDVLVYCDSDTAFFRSFGVDNLLVDGRVGLLDVPYATDATRRWMDRARVLLGTAELDSERSYVGNMICWRREIVIALQERVAQVAGVDWPIAIARGLNFSEYMLYGAFVRDVIGYEASGHAPSDVPLVKASWGQQLHDQAAIDAFFAEFDPRTLGVMMHSKDEIEPATYERYLVRLAAE